MSRACCQFPFVLAAVALVWAAAVAAWWIYSYNSESLSKELNLVSNCESG